MKRNIIIFVIITLGLVAGIGAYFIGSNSENKVTNNYKKILTNSPSSNNKVESSINTDNESSTKTLTAKNVANRSSNQTQTPNNTTINSNVIDKNKTIASSNDVNSSTNSANNINPDIEWVLGKNQNSVPSTIVVKNNTGERIPDQQLVGYIKNWILNGQDNYSQGCAATMWVPEFFNAIPDKDLIQAFIKANGEVALSKSITSGEFAKTNVEVANIILENPPLLTQSQILEYIYENILPKNKISKIENHKNSYWIYSIVNDKQVFWNSVDKYTGMTAC